MQIILTSTEIKYLFDIKSDGTLTKHKALGAKSAYLSRNKWDLKKYLTWYLSNIIDSSGDEKDESLREARLEYWRAKAQEKVFELNVRKDKFLAIEKVSNEWAKRLANLARSLENLSDRLPPMLEGKSRREMGSILKAEVWAFRMAYSQRGRYTPQIAGQLKNEKP